MEPEGRGWPAIKGIEPRNKTKAYEAKESKFLKPVTKHAER